MNETRSRLHRHRRAMPQTVMPHALAGLLYLVKGHVPIAWIGVLELSS